MASPSSSPVEDTTPTPGHTYSAIGTPYWSEHHLSTSNSYFPPTSPDPRSTSPHHPTTGTHPRRISTNRFPRSNSATSISRRQPGRSTSVASSSFTSRPSGMDDRRFLQVDEDEDPEQSSPDAEDDNALGPRGRERSLTRESLHDAGGQWDPTNAPHTGDEQEFTEDDPITVKDRQSLINVQHPFGLPIWKPALYKKSRTVTRNAETDLHAQPSAVIDRHFIPGNVVWTVLFGWWLSATFILLSGVLYIIPFGGKPYARLVYGLGWYLFWPFGKYVQGDQSDVEEKQAEEDNGEEVDDGHASDVERGPRARVPSGSGSQASTGTVRGVSPNIERGVLSSLAAPDDADERSRLLVDVNSPPNKGYGSLPMSPPFPAKEITSFEYAKRHWLGIICFWLALITIIAPLMLIVCLICWACVITIPMARLTWALLKHLFTRPTSIQFCPALALEVVPSQSGASATSASGFTGGGSGFTLKSAPRLTAGQTAPSGPGSKVLICTYRAIGLQYYKYTVGGVNVMFIILLPVVFFVIFDGFVLLPYLEYLEHEHKSIPPLLPFLASRSLIFVLSLTSVIPLSYFIGMAVASISAQSSIGMGAVINATFGSIIEIILYAIALTQGKGKLVEGSIVGSLLAGVLLMPGASMVSGAWRKKEQKFNAKSAGVTSTMLIMAIIGTLTPTMFYQTYGNFELICEGCPPGPANPGETWKCSHCYYDHPDPVEDPFYQNTVKKLMYFCAAILLLSYLIGLWFSLRTHATQIWQNPQPLLNPLDLSHIQGPAGTGTGRMSMVNRIVASHLAQAIPQHNNRLARKASTITSASVREAAQQQPAASVQNTPYLGASAPFPPSGPPSPTINRRISYATGSHPKYQEQSGHHSNQASSTSQPAGSGAGKHIHLPPPLELPTNFTHEEFTRAVAATVSALGQQGPHSAVPDGDGHGGHEAPSWSRGTSATVLLACTALYAAIAEILVDVVDVILEGSGIDEKFLGITLFALVPNTTEFMNAMSFALNGNIALSMEIGSAYALQVCLLQIPAMVGFSAWYDPRHLGEMADTFTLIFPRWDVIAIILSIFLLTYTYIEAKSNYHRGSILILSYVVLTAGFYFAPGQYEDDSLWRYTANTLTSGTLPQLSLMQKLQAVIYSLWKR